MKKSEFKKIVKEAIEEYRTKGAVGKKFRTSGHQEIESEEKQGVLSTDGKVDSLILNKNLRFIKLILFKLGKVDNIVNVDINSKLSKYVDVDEFNEYCDEKGYKINVPEKLERATIKDIATFLSTDHKEEVSPMGNDKEEIEVRNFLSSRKDTDNHISQLLDIASLLRLSIRGHDIDDLFSAISDELDKNPSSIDKVYEFLKDKRLVKESLTIKKLKDIIRECLSEI